MFATDAPAMAMPAADLPWRYDDIDKVTLRVIGGAFNAIAREQLGQLGLAVNLTGRDNVSDQGVSARFHGVARYACICSGRKNIHCSG